MDIDKKTLEKVLSLPDEELKSRLTSAANALGIDPKHTQRISKDLEKYKKALSTLDDKDIKSITNSIEKGKLETIKNEINKIDK